MHSFILIRMQLSKRKRKKARDVNMNIYYWLSHVFEFQDHKTVIVTLCFSLMQKPERIGLV